MASEEDLTREEKICKICNTKRSSGIEKKLSFRSKFDVWLRKKNIEVENIFDKFPKDLDDLAQKYENYMAFIYADGNDIGSLLHKARSPAHYRHIAEGLKNGTEESLFEALFETFEREKIKERREMPFEIINIGGDDISIIIAATFAFDFSVKFLELFERNLKKLGEELGAKITISLGMIICKSTYPIYFAEKLADSLLKDAKARYKELPKDKKENTLSYLYLTSSIAIEDAKEIIDTVYKNEKRILTTRPYTLSELKFLLRISRNIEEIFPATQRNTLIKALSKGRFQSINFLFYQIARMENEKRNKAWEILYSINSQFNSDRGIPDGWVKREGKDATPLIDLLEIIKIRG